MASDESEFTVDSTIDTEEQEIGTEATTADKFLDNIFGAKKEEFITDVEAKFSTVHNDIHEVKNNINDVQTKVKIVNDDLNQVQMGMQSVHERIDNVEKSKDVSEPLEEVVVQKDVDQTDWSKFLF